MTWMPWTSEDYALDECHRQAAELRASGRYDAVRVRSCGDGYGRVYVREAVTS
jgi:hypothetical protein